MPGSSPGHDELYRVPDAVQRPYGAPQSRDPRRTVKRMDPGPAAHRFRAAQHPGNVHPYSAGLACGGGGAADGGVPAALVLAAAALFSTKATAKIEPS